MNNMATEKRLIDANALLEHIKSRMLVTYPNLYPGMVKTNEIIKSFPSVDAVPVDEIKLHHVIIDNEGVPEVKLQIGDRYFLLRTDPVDVREVVHGRWEDKWGGKYANPHYVCSNCKKSALYKCDYQVIGTGLWMQDLTDYCPNCGAKMDGDGNG